MRTFVFIRGLDGHLRRSVVSRVMEKLNPDVNHVRAFKVAMRDHHDDNPSKGDLKAASSSCKNLIKRILLNGQETYLVVDNESILPIHWQTYLTMTENLSIPSRYWAIDVIDAENMNSKVETAQINLQEQNSSLFKDAAHKYWCVRTISDLETLLAEIQTTLEGE